MLSAQATEDAAAKHAVDEKECDLHGVAGCYSCFDRLGEKDDDGDDEAGSMAWLGHRFEIPADKLGKDLAYRKQKSEADLDVIDPRERESQFKTRKQRLK